MVPEDGGWQLQEIEVPEQVHTDDQIEQVHTEDQIDAASNLMRGFEADTFCKALDVLGWKIVVQDPDQRSHWPLSFHYENCPDWAENGDEPLPSRIIAKADATEQAVWGYDENQMEVAIIKHTDGLYYVMPKTGTVHLAGPFRHWGHARNWCCRHRYKLI